MRGRGEILIAIAIGVLGGLAVFSCTVNRRSDDYSCTSNADCQGGRTCERGYCVAGGGSNKAAGGPSPCAPCDPDALDEPGRCDSLGSCPGTAYPSAGGEPCRENGLAGASCDSTNGTACDTCF